MDSQAVNPLTDARFSGATAALDLELPVLDPRMLEHTAAHLPPGAIVRYMQTIAVQGEALLSGLIEPDALRCNGYALADAAHKLAGNAGVLGFSRLSTACRRFEQSLQSGAAEATALADSVVAAIDATCQEIRAQTEESVPPDARIARHLKRE
jgi:HPt (histidine-containing phosphotransfer) domain-containing protein